MSYTAKQWRAIHWFVERDDLKPQISAWPMVRFVQPDGKVLEETISTIVDWYDNHRAQEARLRAEARTARGKS